MPDDKSPHTSEYCLARAVQCEELAEKATFAENKAILLDIAKRWRVLAAESERALLHRTGQSVGSPSSK